MSIDKFNQWLMLAANIGVLGGIIFLAYEIRQNTTQLRSEASYSITEAVNSMNANEYANPELADLLYRGDLDFNNLSDIEKNRYSSYQFSRLNLAEYILILESEGLSDLQFPYIEVLAREFSDNPGLRQWFRTVDAGYLGLSDYLVDVLRPISVN